MHALVDAALAAEFHLDPLVSSGQFLEALEALLPHLYPAQTGRTERTAWAWRLRDQLFMALLEAMKTSVAPPRTRMKFGTSGWRGLLLHDFTLHNVACVTQGLVDVLLDPHHHRDLGVQDAEELRARGCVLAHDTRVAGPELCDMAARVLLAHGIRVIALGMATTPEVSAAISVANAAFSINFTPSHNPWTWHGYKFNPADGGPAPASLTAPVAARANEIFDGKLGYTAISEAELETARHDAGRYQAVDPIATYRKAVQKRLPWVNLQTLAKAINQSGLEIYIDNGYGATRGKYERLLEGVNPEQLHIFRGEEDWLFGGQNVEPSADNLAVLQAQMKDTPSRLAVAIMNDGDGDRFVGGGREAVLVMNRFGPLVVRYLSQEHRIKGDVTRSVMTSHMADAARATYQPEGTLQETAVGFQYMRPFVQRSVNSWEESDGMSPMGWSRDKDGLAAALMLISMVLHYQENPEVLLENLEQELGYFYFERRKVTVRKTGEALTSALQERFRQLRPGTSLEIAGRIFTVARQVTIDGFKLIFDNGWWFGVRPSGTEPVVRPYVETFTGAGADAAQRAEAEGWKNAILEWLVAEVNAILG